MHLEVNLVKVKREGKKHKEENDNMPVNDLLGFETIVPVGVCTVSIQTLPNGAVPVVTESPSWASAMAAFWLQPRPRAIVYEAGKFRVIGTAGPLVPLRPCDQPHAPSRMQSKPE